MGFNVRYLILFTNKILSISITQKKYIIDTNTIRSTRHRQIWDRHLSQFFFFFLTAQLLYKFLEQNIHLVF